MARKVTSLPWIDRVTLVAVQFDLTFTIDPAGKSIKLIDVPDTVSLERAYALTGPADNVKKLSAAFPNSQLRAAGGKLHVRGPAEDVDLIEAALQGKTARRTTVSAGKQVYTLQVANVPVGRLLGELAKQMDLELKLDEAAIQAAGLSLEKAISLDVKGVSADELLQAAVGPAGLTFTRKDKALEVGPKK